MHFPYESEYHFWFSIPIGQTDLFLIDPNEMKLLLSYSLNQELEDCNEEMSMAVLDFWIKNKEARIGPPDDSGIKLLENLGRLVVFEQTIFIQSDDYASTSHDHFDESRIIFFGQVWKAYRLERTIVLNPLLLLA